MPLFQTAVTTVTIQNSCLNQIPMTGSDSFINLFSSITKSLSINAFLIIATLADEFSLYVSIIFEVCVKAADAKLLPKYKRSLHDIIFFCK